MTHHIAPSPDVSEEEAIDSLEGNPQFLYSTYSSNRAISLRRYPIIPRDICVDKCNRRKKMQLLDTRYLAPFSLLISQFAGQQCVVFELVDPYFNG